MKYLEGWIEARVRERIVAVVGLGNRSRGDDGAGPRVVERLGEGGDWLVLDAGTVPENFLGPLLDAAPDVVLFVDALDHGAAPGACGVLAADGVAERASSTHAPSLRLITRFLRERGAECWMIGIQPQRMTGTELTPAVAASVTELAQVLSAVRARLAVRTPETVHA